MLPVLCVAATTQPTTKAAWSTKISKIDATILPHIKTSITNIKTIILYTTIFRRATYKKTVLHVLTQT